MINKHKHRKPTNRPPESRHTHTHTPRMSSSQKLYESITRSQIVSKSNKILRKHFQVDIKIETQKFKTLQDVSMHFLTMLLSWCRSRMLKFKKYIFFAALCSSSQPGAANDLLNQKIHNFEYANVSPCC